MRTDDNTHTKCDIPHCQAARPPPLPLRFHSCSRLQMVQPTVVVPSDGRRRVAENTWTLNWLEGQRRALGGPGGDVKGRGKAVTVE